MIKKQLKYSIIISLILFLAISIISIYSALSINSSAYITKQIGWYIIGFFIIILSRKFNYKKIIDISPILFIIGNITLLLLLIFAPEINGSKCWFIIPGIGSFQPSEFMKLILILIIVKIFDIYNKKYKIRTLKNDIKLFIIIILITLIPSILTFLQPDTGIVIIYFIISLAMLFVFGIKKRIFIFIISIFLISIGIFFYFYFNYQDNFINLFGTSFFYRIDRLLDWSNKSGMQLTNALTAIKSAGINGFGIGKTPIYIPEAHTDFIFSIFSNNTGFIGSILLIIIIILFDFSLFNISRNTKNKNYRFFIIGFLAMILYQQIQNIGMNIGLLPITGITLPFISYGGSSLLSYMLAIAFILNYENNEKSQNKNS